MALMRVLIFIFSVLLFAPGIWAQEKVIPDTDPGYDSEETFVFDLEEINTPGNASLRALCAVDENTVWTAGSMGKVYRSLDSGQSWEDCSIPGCEETEFRSLYAWDKQRALVFDVSPKGRAFLSSNGGKNWELVYQSPKEGAFFNSLKCANDSLGVAISDPIDEQVFVIQTEDGGRTWNRLRTLPRAEPGEINFAASNTCISYLPSGEIYIVTGGSKARVLTSYDHGRSWDYVDTPVITGESAGLFSIQSSGSGRGAAVGGDYKEPERDGIRAIYTEDGGRTWRGAEGLPAAYRSCLVSLDENILFAIGKTGCDYSMDYGKNWTFVNSTGYYAADAVSGKAIVFLSGAEGKVARMNLLKR